MHPRIKDLLVAIVSYIHEHDGYVTKTKLLKLVYLFDVEFYRRNRRLFTGFNWKFFHLGPWTREFDPIVDDLVRSGALLEVQSTKSEYDTKFFRAETPLDFSSLFSSFDDEASLRIVLNAWGDRSTGEILDHVYFRTEPMEQGIRNEVLDFSLIPEGRPEKYVRSSSGKSSRQIIALKKEFAERVASLPKSQGEKRFRFTPPRYDDEFVNAMAKLDVADA
jgi:hypothetical protein